MPPTLPARTQGRPAGCPAAVVRSKPTAAARGVASLSAVMEASGDVRLAAEQRARAIIDRQLSAAGWVVQDRGDLNLFAGTGVAVREVIMAAGHGRADYVLYICLLYTSPSPRDG